jgi:hypothetical protein
MHTSADQQVLERIRAEYLEMPGLCLKADQVQRLCGVEREHKSLAFVWLITLGLLGLTVAGVVAGSWLLLFVLVALTTPAVVLRNPHPVGVIARSRQRPRVVSYARDQSPLDRARSTSLGGRAKAAHPSLQS